MADRYEDLELLLGRQDRLKAEREERLRNRKNNDSIQKANKSASLYDFITMLNKVCSLTMPDVEFIPDEGRITKITESMKNLDHPYITYTVKERIPKGELKHRLREEIYEETDDKGNKRLGEVWGQKFKCCLQFNIFACEYKEAEEVMEKFEELMISYAGYFKQNGVAELFFQKHFTDDYYQNLRETLSIRNLCYYVEIEKQTVIFREKIQEIELLAQEENE